MLLPLCMAVLFLVGVLVGTFTDIQVPEWTLLVPVLLLLWHPQRGLFLLALFFGLWRVGLFESSLLVNPPVGFVEIEGPIVSEVDRRLDHQKITVNTEYGRILAKVSQYESLEFGDHVRLWGEVEEPTNDIEGFNYAAYLARYRISLVMIDPRVEVIARGPPSFRRLIYSFKGTVERRINRLFMEPEASFVAGLLLGSRKGMPEELALAFQAVGLTHIVAISGYNISLVIALIFLSCAFLPLKWRVFVSSIAIFVFVILVGASAAVVRAGLMGVLTLWALFTGHKSQVFFALLWSALLMVLWNPYILAYDVGFQLSFASTFGLLVFVPILEKWTRWWTKALVFKEALLLTLAAQIATFPITAFEFGRLSLISPLANVLAAPFIPLSMLGSAFALIFGLPFVLLAWFPLKMVEWVALGLAQLPFISVELSMDVGGYILSWGFLLAFCFRFYKPILVRAFFRGPVSQTSMPSVPQFERHEKQSPPLS